MIQLRNEILRWKTDEQLNAIITLIVEHAIMLENEVEELKVQLENSRRLNTHFIDI